jgi:hypothetical protein
MTRKLRKITRRFVLVVAIAALAVPATAAAHPSGSPGGVRQHQAPAFVPSDPGQKRLSDSALPAGVVLRKSGPVDQGPKLAPVTAATTTTTAGSGFDWNDALIGAGFTATLMALAMGGALVARRQGRLGYR